MDDDDDVWFQGYSGPLNFNIIWPVSLKGVLIFAAMIIMAGGSLGAIKSGIITDQQIPLLLLAEAVPAYVLVQLVFNHIDWDEYDPSPRSDDDLRDGKP